MTKKYRLGYRNAMPTLATARLTKALLLSAVLAAGCQKLDPNLATGSLSPSGSGGNSPGTTGTGNVGGTDSSPCPDLRTQAFDILQTNCAICHQAPGMPALYPGPFNFILDLDMLTSSTSPQSSSTQVLKYVVKGNPGKSFIYQRITNGTMPPAMRIQRPSSGDRQVLSQWITSCIDDPTSPEGWSGSGSLPDAGIAPGPMLDPCGAANVCPNGGCCVFNKCRPNGTTCGPLPNPIPGQVDLPGFPGTCTTGSCQTPAGDSCGKPDEPCCGGDLFSCTASQSSCLITDMTKCTACGGLGQPCCKPTNCLDDLTCVGGGVGRVGVCEECGELGQACCGSGVAALRTCDGDLTCVPITGGAECVAGDGDGGVD